METVNVNIVLDIGIVQRIINQFKMNYLFDLSEEIEYYLGEYHE